MANFFYKSLPLTSIFESGNGYTLTNYTNAGSSITFKSQLADLPDQTIGFEVSGTDIGASACPIFYSYPALNTTHTCDANATKVYVIIIGGGGGGGSGGSTGGAQDSYFGDGGGGGGGGGMVAFLISISSNPTITTPISIAILRGLGGAGGDVLSANGAGNNGTAGGHTTATIACSGTDIILIARGGAGGIGGGNDTTAGTASGTGGAGGGRDTNNGLTFTATVEYSTNGNAGAAGTAGTSDNTDTSAGGAGGASGRGASGKFLDFSTTYGNGGTGGSGDKTGVEFGGAGGVGTSGVVYIFEYFD